MSLIIAVSSNRSVTKIDVIRHLNINFFFSLAQSKFILCYLSEKKRKLYVQNTYVLYCLKLPNKDITRKMIRLCFSITNPSTVKSFIYLVSENCFYFQAIFVELSFARRSTENRQNDGVFRKTVLRLSGRQ